MRWIADVRADRLQARLFRDLAAERAGDPWSPSTVLTPTDVLAEHLRERAVEHGNWAGLFVRSFRAEARERLRLAGVATDPLPRHARLDLLVHVGESLRGNV